MRRVVRSGWKAAFVLAVAGCAALPGPLRGVEPLPAIATARPGVLSACPAALAVGVLAGDPEDPMRVWLVGPGGERIDVRWPWGFGVRFARGAEVVAPDGGLVARAGDRVVLGGGFGDDEVFRACDVSLEPTP